MNSRIRHITQSSPLSFATRPIDQLVREEEPRLAGYGGFPRRCIDAAVEHGASRTQQIARILALQFLTVLQWPFNMASVLFRERFCKASRPRKNGQLSTRAFGLLLE